MAGRALVLVAALAVACRWASALHLGGIEKATPDEEHIQHVARFAVEQLNGSGDNGPGDLSLERVLSARKQLVAGTLYFLTVQAVEGGSGAQRKFEVAVYEPFGKHMNTLKLTHYKEAGKTTPPASGKLPQEMPIMMLQPASRIPIDEAVSEGAAYAVMELTQQSNSLIPWSLKEVTGASSMPDGVYRLKLHVVRGQEEKLFEVDVRHADADNWLVMGPFTPLAMPLAE